MKKNIFVTGLLVAGLSIMAIPVLGQVSVYFKFDQFDGQNFTDDSGYALEGELPGGIGKGIPESTDGVTGSSDDFAVSFDGTGSLVVNDTEEWNFSLFPPMTIELWVRSDNPDQEGDNATLVSYGFPGNSSQESGGYRLGIREGVLMFTLLNIIGLPSEVVFPYDGEWHHVAAVYDPYEDGGVTYYLDGEAQGFVEETREPYLPESENYIGRHELDIGAITPGFLIFDGDMDRIRISEEALDTDTLDSDPNTVKPVTDSTVAFLAFDKEEPPYSIQGTASDQQTVTVEERIAEGAVYDRILSSPEIVDNSPSGEEGDTSLKFTGQEYAVVEVPEIKFMDFQDWTMEAWVIPEPYETRLTLMNYGVGGGGGYNLVIGEVDNPTLWGTAAGIVAVKSSVPVPLDGEWHHIAVAHRNGESMTYYHDGVEVEVIEYDQGLNPPTTNLIYIGTWPGLTAPYVGLMDRVRITGAALTADELDSDPANPIETDVQKWAIY